jgi:hypothetical protein
VVCRGVPDWRPTVGDVFVSIVLLLFPVIENVGTGAVCHRDKVGWWVGGALSFLVVGSLVVNGDVA